MATLLAEVAKCDIRCRHCHAKRHGREKAARTHCARGHAWDAANTYVNPQGDRCCRTCARDRYLERRGEITMTDAQHDVLLALNLRQMQGADVMEEGDGVWTNEIASVCGRSNRSAGVVLSQMRDFGWVQSTHYDGREMAWLLTGRGVAALERERLSARDKAWPR